MARRIVHTWKALAAGALLSSFWCAGQERVVVTPRCEVLLPGQSCTFKARRAAQPPAAAAAAGWLWSLPDGGEGSLQEATGVFTAPAATQVLRIRVRAVPGSAPEAGQAGEATVTVLPNQPFGIIGQVLGHDWLEPYDTALPFLDLATGQRFPGRGPVVGSSRPELLRRLFSAIGLPVTLHWTPPPGVVAQMLSYWEGDQLVRLDVTDQWERRLTFRAPVRDCMVEALRPGASKGAGWTSHVYLFRVELRGLFPFAGNPAAVPGHEDGAGLSARFREAFDLKCSWQAGSYRYCVTDPASHGVRTVDLHGGVQTLCGEPGHPGHRDSPGLLRRLGTWILGLEPCRARFNRPTYLEKMWVAAAPNGGFWAFLVADSGNNVVRRVDPDGTVTTLAGVPRRPGHRDAKDPRAALFSDPRGLAVANEGRTYIADHGNQVIRCLDRHGVSTLAGKPGEAGDRDGTGEAARFQDLKGLMWVATNMPSGMLLILDGHALRQLRLADRKVTTLVGQVGQPGFRDVGAGDGEEALRQPCLRDPEGLRGVGDTLYLADTGNHAVRRMNQTLTELVTVLGDPSACEDRWGLPRDGVPGPLAPECAALESPTAILINEKGGIGDLLVASGGAVLDFRAGTFGRDQPVVAGLEAGEARAGQPVTIVCAVLAESSLGGWSVQRTYRYALDVVDPSGALAQRRRGEGSTLVPLVLQGSFSAAGTGILRLSVVTDQGMTAGAQTEVQVGD